jgi:hypothetical protein
MIWVFHPGSRIRIQDLDPQHWHRVCQISTARSETGTFPKRDLLSKTDLILTPMHTAAWKSMVCTGNLVHFCWLLPAECLFPPHLSCQTITVNITSAASLDRFSVLGCHSSDWVGVDRVFNGYRYRTAKDDGFWRFRISPRPTVPPKNYSKPNKYRTRTMT